MLKIALEDVAKAVGITNTTKKPTSKEDLCSTLNKNGSLDLKTFQKILETLGLKIKVAPVEESILH
jgi:DNA-binding phage protein